MANLNEFFRKLYSNPSLLWKASAGLLFLGLAVAMFVSPNLVQGLEKSTRITFAVLLLVYGLFRLSTFFVEYKRLNDE
ncbi:MAG: hypothetical protein KIS94_04160 [Chitinophagales bacterium]|nr:hypothetical protein [Chitinophagales bacterium]